MKAFDSLHSILIGVAILLAAPFSAYAETVTTKEANRLAQTFFNAAAGEVLGRPRLVYNGRDLVDGRWFSPFYIYNSRNGGYVIIAGDNKAFPVLGYSLTENFDPEAADEVVMEKLADYAREIESIRFDGRVPEEAINAWTSIPAYLQGVLDNRDIHGKSHYRLADDYALQGARLRDSATEFPDIAVAVSENAEDFEETELTDEPFSLYDDFVAETRAEDQRRRDMLDDIVSPSEPIVRAIGGGHFEITLPEEATQATVYNMQGAVVDMFTYRGSNVIEINLNRVPTGFYVAIAFTVNGRTYSFKLYK